MVLSKGNVSQGTGARQSVRESLLENCAKR